MAAAASRLQCLQQSVVPGRAQSLRTSKGVAGRWPALRSKSACPVPTPCRCAGSARLAPLGRMTRVAVRRYGLEEGTLVKASCLGPLPGTAAGGAPPAAAAVATPDPASSAAAGGAAADGAPAAVVQTLALVPEPDTAPAQAIEAAADEGAALRLGAPAEIEVQAQERPPEDALEPVAGPPAPDEAVEAADAALADGAVAGPSGAAAGGLLKAEYEEQPPGGDRLPAAPAVKRKPGAEAPQAEAADALGVGASAPAALPAIKAEPAEAGAPAGPVGAAGAHGDGGEARAGPGPAESSALGEGAPGMPAEAAVEGTRDLGLADAAAPAPVLAVNALPGHKRALAAASDEEGGQAKRPRP